MTTIHAFGNEKGGVGKTTVTLAAASTLADAGMNILLIDLDPQRTLTNTFQLELGEDALTIFDILAQDEGEDRDDGAAEHAIVATGWQGIDIVPGSRAVANIVRGREHAPIDALKNALNFTAIEDYDHVLIDMPPTVGVMSEIAITAADKVWAVTQPAGADVQGLNDFVETVAALGKDLSGIFVNAYDSRKAEHTHRMRELQAVYPGLVLDPPVPSRVAAMDMISFNEPLSANKTAGGSRLQAVYQILVSNL